MNQQFSKGVYKISKNIFCNKLPKKKIKFLKLIQIIIKKYNKQNKQLTKFKIKTGKLPKNNQNCNTNSKLYILTKNNHKKLANKNNN